MGASSSKLASTSSRSGQSAGSSVGGSSTAALIVLYSAMIWPRIPWASVGARETGLLPGEDDREPLGRPDQLRGADDGEEKPLQLVVAERACRSGRMVQERLEGAGVGEGGISSERIADGGRCHLVRDLNASLGLPTRTAMPPPYRGGGSGGSQLGRCRGRGMAVRWQWQCWDRGRGGVSRRGRAPSAPRTRVSPSLPLQVAEG